MRRPSIQIGALADCCIAATCCTATTHSGDSTSTLVGKSLVNSLVIVTALAAATCVIVLLYRFRFMKCLIGYMMLSSALLLGIMGGLLWYTVSYALFSSVT
jgi:Presenilin